MPTPIRIEVGPLRLQGEFNDTPCARAIVALLPISAEPDTWGDEFFFPIGLDHPLEKGAAERVEAGEIGYWPPGRALAIFFGPTPASQGSEPVAASAVNRVGRILGDATVLRAHRNALRIRLVRAEE